MGLTLKVECQCGTRFKFEVEPVNGKMPVQVFCPHCGLDSTEEANRLIEVEQAKAAGKPVPEKIQVPKVFKVDVAKPGLKLASKRPPQHTVSLPPQETKVSLQAACPKHPREHAVNSCLLCKKPICLVCMSKYGYFCSTTCRHQAEQRGMKIPVYEQQESYLREKGTLHAKQVAVMVVIFVVMVSGFWVWYSFFGSKPSIKSAVKIDHAEQVEYCKFIGANQVLLKSDRTLSLYDASGLKPIWSTSLASYQAPMPSFDEEGGEEAKMETLEQLKARISQGPASDEFLSRFLYYAPYLAEQEEVQRVHVHGEDIWVLFEESLVVFDRKTGKEKKKVELKGRILQLVTADFVIFVTGTGRPNEGQITRVAFRTGDVLSNKITLPEPQKWTVGGLAPRIQDEGSALLGNMAVMMEAGMNAGTDQELDLGVEQHQLRFIPAGANVARMEIDLVEKNVTARQVVNPEDLKPKEELGKDGPVKVTDAMALAKEMQYESIKARGGVFEREDLSRYKVTLKRQLEEGAPVWTGEVIGPPIFCPLKTVDALVSSKSILVFDKENEKLWESPLAFPAEKASVSFGGGQRGPCFEAGNTLYLYDTQAITSFELQTGKVRWRMPLAAVESIRLDGAGMLYITTLDGVSKADPENGKILWKLDKKGVEFYITNKYVYLSKQQVSGADMIQNMWTGKEIPTHFRIFRIDPKSGEVLWEYYQPKAPSEMDFASNKILLFYSDQYVKDMQTHSGRRAIPSELQILKYLTL